MKAMEFEIDCNLTISKRDNFSKIVNTWATKRKYHIKLDEKLLIVACLIWEDNMWLPDETYFLDLDYITVILLNSYKENKDFYYMQIFYGSHFAPLIAHKKDQNFHKFHKELLIYLESSRKK